MDLRQALTAVHATTSPFAMRAGQFARIEDCILEHATQGQRAMFQPVTLSRDVKWSLLRAVAGSITLFEYEKKPGSPANSFENWVRIYAFETNVSTAEATEAIFEDIRAGELVHVPTTYAPTWTERDLVDAAYALSDEAKRSGETRVPSYLANEGVGNVVAGILCGTITDRRDAAGILGLARASKDDTIEDFRAGDDEYQPGEYAETPCVICNETTNGEFVVKDANGSIAAICDDQAACRRRIAVDEHSELQIICRCGATPGSEDNTILNIIRELSNLEIRKIDRDLGQADYAAELRTHIKSLDNHATARTCCAQTSAARDAFTQI